MSSIFVTMNSDGVQDIRSSLEKFIARRHAVSLQSLRLK